MKKTILPAVILGIICLITAALLAGTNYLTADRIAEAEAKRLEDAARSVLTAANTLEPLARDDMKGYIGYDENGDIVGYTFQNAYKGYGGDVTAVVGISTDGKITGVAVTAPDETPGLGSNVKNDSFLSVFLGKDAATKFVIKENVDAVTSATYSSKAVVAGVNAALENYRTLTKGELSNGK